MSDEEFIAEIRRRSEAIDRWCEVARRDFDANRIVVVEHGHLRFALHLSPRKGVNYQVSWWSNGDPGGHTDYQDFTAAAKELFWELPDDRRRQLEDEREFREGHR